MNYMGKFLLRISNNLYISAIRKSFLLIMPLIFIGSFSVLINYLPIGGYQIFVLSHFGPKWAVMQQNQPAPLLEYVLVLQNNHHFPYRFPYALMLYNLKLFYIHNRSVSDCSLRLLLGLKPACT